MSEQTTGGVTFADTLGYTKPKFLPITVPTESEVANKYYVDMTNGSGTTYSEGSPGATLEGLVGKTGIDGGPAYVYLKGAGRLDISGVTFRGGAGTEIVIKPWPGESNPVTMTTTGGAAVTDANQVTGANVSHIIIDGGPSMLFRFVGAETSGTQNAYTLVVSSNNITVARCRVNGGGVAGGSGPGVGIATGQGTVTDDCRLINCEIYDVLNDEGAAYGVYVGGGANCATGSNNFNDLSILNCVFRSCNNKGIQVEHRNNQAGHLIITGNAFHTINDHAAIVLADACGGTFSTALIANNIMFDLGFGGIMLFFNQVNVVVESNTIYDFAQNQTGTLNSHGISSFADGDDATVRNNAVALNNNTADGINAYNRNSGWTSSNNFSDNGTASADFQSVDSGDSTFLWPTDTGDLYGAGNASVNATDYRGQSRPLNGNMDIGAIEFGPAESVSRRFYSMSYARTLV